MKKLGFLVILTVALGVGWRPVSGHDDGHLFFAVPVLEGTISLGVYDEDGALVRVLYSDVEVADFHKGLDGLMARWDELDEEDNPVPPGLYHVKGYVVPGLTVGEGRSIEVAAPALAAVVDFGFLGQDRFWVLEETMEGRRLMSWPFGRSLDSGQVMAEWGDSGTRVAASPDGTWVVAWDEEGLDFIRPQDEDVLLEAPISGPQCLTVDNAGSVAMFSEGIFHWSKGEGDWERTDGGGIEAEAMLFVEGRLVCLSDGGVFEVAEGAVVELEIPALDHGLSIATGEQGVFWAVDQTANGTVLKAFELSGEYLREMPSEPARASYLAVAGSHDGERLILRVRSPDGAESLRFLQKTAATEGDEPVSFWQTVQEKQVTPVGTGLGGFSKDGEEVSDRVEVVTMPNPLEGDREGELSLRVLLTEEGVAVADACGLPLRLVTDPLPEPLPETGLIADGEGLEVALRWPDFEQRISVHNVYEILAIDAGEWRVGEGPSADETLVP